MLKHFFFQIVDKIVSRYDSLNREISIKCPKKYRKTVYPVAEILNIRIVFIGFNGFIDWIVNMRNHVFAIFTTFDHSFMSIGIVFIIQSINYLLHLILLLFVFFVVV